MSFDTNDYEKCQRLFALITSTAYKDFIKIFFKKIDANIKTDDLSVGENFDLTDFIKEFEEFLQQEEFSIDISSEKFVIELFPIMEYFFIKSLRPATIFASKINSDFSLNIPTITLGALSFVKTLTDDRFEAIQRATQDNPKAHKSLNMSIENSIHCIQNAVIAKKELCHAIECEEKFKDINSTQIFINGPLLTSNIISCLLHNNGTVRQTGLGEVNEWKIMLKKIRDMLWTNTETCDQKFDLLQNELINTRTKAETLLECVETVKGKCLSMENENFNDFNNDFWNLSEKLKEEILSCDVSRVKMWSKNFIASSITSAIELNLLSYFPLIDPVKKNRLKTRYIEQDIDHLERILSCYKLMSTILDYRNLGLADRKLLDKELISLNEKLSKHSKKVALRPEICVYNTMVKEVNHFLTSFCHPKQLLSLITSFEVLSSSKNKTAITELMNKLDLWISNADNFMNHTLKKYNVFYRDFIAPIEFSITSLKNGFLGLRSLLQMGNNSIIAVNGAYYDCNENGELMEVMKELISFPGGKILLIL